MKHAYTLSQQVFAFGLRLDSAPACEEGTTFRSVPVRLAPFGSACESPSQTEGWRQPTEERAGHCQQPQQSSGDGCTEMGGADARAGGGEEGLCESHRAIRIVMNVAVVTRNCNFPRFHVTT